MFAGPGQPQASRDAHGFFGLAQLAGGVELGVGLGAELVGFELVGAVLLGTGVLLCTGLLVGGLLVRVGLAVGFGVDELCQIGGRVGWKFGTGRSGVAWACQCQVLAPAAPLEASDNTNRPAPNSSASRRCRRTSSFTIERQPSSRYTSRLGPARSIRTLAVTIGLGPEKLSRLAREQVVPSVVPCLGTLLRCFIRILNQRQRTEAPPTPRAACHIAA